MLMQASSVNGCHSPTMDMLLSANDSLSFQEMLDVDIKSEIDTVLGGHSDFSAFSFSDLPPLELDDDPTDINMWFSTSSTSNNSNSSNFNIDFIGSEAAAMMVNPNSVMPLTLVARQSVAPTTTARSVSPTDEPARPSSPQPKPLIKHILSEARKPISKTIKISSPTISKSVVRQTQTITPISDKQQSVLNIKNAIQRQITTNGNVMHAQTQQINGARLVRKQQLSRYSDDEKVYPKPAYSYSCLIAMALKNSRTGSLPVSEIYNFMW